MATFEIVEDEELKLIKATIKNETIRAEAGALHYMIGERNGASGRIFQW